MIITHSYLMAMSFCFHPNADPYNILPMKCWLCCLDMCKNLSSSDSLQQNDFLSSVQIQVNTAFLKYIPSIGESRTISQKKNVVVLFVRNLWILISLSVKYLQTYENKRDDKVLTSDVNKTFIKCIICNLNENIAELLSNHGNNINWAEMWYLGLEDQVLVDVAIHPSTKSRLAGASGHLLPCTVRHSVQNGRIACQGQESGLYWSEAQPQNFSLTYWQYHII